MLGKQNESKKTLETFVNATAISGFGSELQVDGR